MRGPQALPLSSRLPGRRSSQQGAAPQEAPHMEDSRECPLVEATAAPSLAWLGPGPMLDCMQVYFLFHGYRHGPLYL